MPQLVVMKFGGTSVVTPDARSAVAARISERHAEGCQVVVVVSAMGRKGQPYATDTLLELAADCHGPDSASRERDAIAAVGEDLAAAVLASELIARDLPAISLRSHQAGILTDGVFQNARIERIDPTNIRRRLDDGRIVVITGFQGMSSDGDITTLGRGGSDTSAVAIGASLAADLVEIFTDVEGVFSADPRVVPEAQVIPELPYHEAAEMAHGGARVIHPRAAEVAARHGLDVRIRSTFSDAPGTLLRPNVTANGGKLEGCGDRLACAVASIRDVSQVAVVSPEFMEEPGRVCDLLDRLAEARISLDMINILDDRLVSTVKRSDLTAATTLLEDAGYTPQVKADCAKVTLIGGGIHGVPGVVARMARLLHAACIPILQSVDSSMIVSVLVPAGDEARAVRALHAGFLDLLSVAEDKRPAL